MKLFAPPANINDFDENSQLSIKWNDFLFNRFTEEIIALENTLEDDRSDMISFFNPQDPPEGNQLYRLVTWLGFPNTQIIAKGLEEALKASEDPIEVKRYAKNGNNYEEISIYVRAFQDEYLEWAVHKDQKTGKIKEIIFTCEGPEYWDTISQDKDLLLKLYHKYVSEDVQESDLFHTTDIYRRIQNGESNDMYRLEAKKGDYNIWNKWNISHAIHLHQPNNSLAAEINIAARATILRKNDDQLLTDAHSLICCSGYGGPNRNSDPTIGEAVNSQVRSKRWVSLREPIGIYISDIDSSSFKKPGGSLILDFKQRYWTVIRGDEENKMILRAVLRVPEGELIENRQLLLGDLLIDGEPLRYAGQVANTITVGLFATAVQRSNGRSKILPCPRKCCQNVNTPALDNIIYADEECKETEELDVALTKIQEIPYEILPSRTRY